MKKVLIAEDSSVIQNLTKKILENLNYQITPAKNGQQVMDLISREDFDIILMDINMPVMSGLECAQKIRSLKDTKKSELPIIAITGNAMNYSLEEFQNMGINDFLQKPLNFDALVTMVNKYTKE